MLWNYVLVGSVGVIKSREVMFAVAIYRFTAPWTSIFVLKSMLKEGSYLDLYWLVDATKYLARNIDQTFWGEFWSCIGTTLVVSSDALIQTPLWAF